MDKRFSVAMFTNYDYYGQPIETSRVELSMSDSVDWTPDMIAALKRQALERLHSMAKQLPTLNDTEMAQVLAHYPFVTGY